MAKKFLVLLVFLIVAIVPVAAFAEGSDRVVLDGFWGHFEKVIAEGDETAAGGPIFVGPAAIFGGDGWGVLNIYLTEAGSNVISDHLFSRTGASHACDTTTAVGADCIFFSSDPSSDPVIGTLCTGGPAFCREEDGTLQDVTDMVTLQNGGRGICCPGSIHIQSDVPEPAALSLILMGLAGSIPVIRYRKRS